MSRRLTKRELAERALKRSLWRKVWKLNRERPRSLYREIPEGADDDVIPVVGHGRIRSGEDIAERYATATRDGLRLFAAWGYYGPEDCGRRSRRYWFSRSATPPS